MGGKEVPTQNIWGTVSEISVTVDVCSGNVKYYILVRGTSEGDKSQSHISSHFAPIEYNRELSSFYLQYSSVLCGDPALRFCSGNLISKVDSVLVAMRVKNEYIN